MVQTGHAPLCRWTTACPMCLCLVRDTLALWQMACPAQMPVASSISCNYENYCNMGLGGMPRRPKWGAWGYAVHLSGATGLECCHYRWACLGSTTNRFGPQQCPVQQCDNHHSGSHYHTSATPFSGCHCWAFSWHHHDHHPTVPGALEWLQQASPTISIPVSWHSMLKRELPSAALGAQPPSKVTQGPPGLNEKCPDIHALTASLTHASPWAVMPEDIPSITDISHSPSPPTMPKIPEVTSTFPIPQPQVLPRVDPARLPDEVLQLQWQMNVALEQLLTTRATRDSHCRGLELNTELTVCMNEAKAIEAIKEAEVSHAVNIKGAKVCHTTTIKEASCTIQPGSKRLRFTMSPIPVSCSKPTWKVC